MGRPRKRRREGQADESAELLAEEQTEHATVIDEYPVITPFSDFGLISPPPLHNANHSSGSTADGTPSQHSLSLPDTFGISTPSNLEYGLFHASISAMLTPSQLQLGPSH